MSQISVPNTRTNDATYWADLIRAQLSNLASYNAPEHAAIDEAVMKAPRRRAANPNVAALAMKTAQLLYPSTKHSLKALIQYEKDVVSLRHIVVEQRKRQINEATERNDVLNWGKRILKQGVWDPTTDPWSLAGAPSLPMPVSVAEPGTLIPFFKHLALDGTEVQTSTACAMEKASTIEEPYYNVKSLEFEKGVLYSDRRLDLCKMVLGPQNIGDLMESLKTNEFVKHILLGNNIVGPRGAKCIAEFVQDFTNRIDTWYLAGNCIDTASLRSLVDEWVNSTSITNIWLKRNPLMPESADDIFRLIVGTANLRTLDLDQTELGDAGVARLFTKLVHHVPQNPLPLRHMYLSTVGIGVKGATAIAEFLSSPECRLDAIYAGNNPLGNEGVIALAKGLRNNKSLTRLTLPSVGMSDDGAIALCEALCEHELMTTLDIGQSFATEDLGSRYMRPYQYPKIAYADFEQIQLDHRQIRRCNPRPRQILSETSLSQSPPMCTHAYWPQQDPRCSHWLTHASSPLLQDHLPAKQGRHGCSCRSRARTPP